MRLLTQINLFASIPTKEIGENNISKICNNCFNWWGKTDAVLIARPREEEQKTAEEDDEIKKDEQLEELEASETTKEEREERRTVTIRSKLEEEEILSIK